MHPYAVRHGESRARKTPGYPPLSCATATAYGLAHETHCNTLQHTALLCNTLQHTAPHCTTLHHALQHTAAHCNTLQHTATHCNTLQHTATLCNTLQHTATHCNTLQHTAQNSRGVWTRPGLVYMRQHARETERARELETAPLCLTATAYKLALDSHI